MSSSGFDGKLALQQRVLTPYRAALFDMLAPACLDGLSVCAGLPRPEESIAVSDHLRLAAFAPVQNMHILRGRGYLCYQRGLRAWLEQCAPDALIVEANPRYLATPAAVRWMKRRGKAVIGWGLGAPATDGAFSDLRQARRRAFLRPFDAMLTYSRRGAEEYASLGFPAERIFIAPNAAAARPNRPAPFRRSEWREQPNVLFVGRLQARKRLDLLLQACAALPTELQPHLVIVGDGPERSRLETLAQSLYPTVVFTGEKHGDELAAYFCAADLFVLPGTGGLAVQEAMSYGLPVIMGQGDGTNDSLVRTSNGWQIPPDDLTALTRTLVMALADSHHLRRMGAESYRIVREEVNLEKMVEVFLQALEAVCCK